MSIFTYEREILSFLDEDGGYDTGTVAKSFPSPFARNVRQHSSDVRAWLINMEKNGLVRRLDHFKPVAWLRTAAGTEALRKARRAA